MKDVENKDKRLQYELHRCDQQNNQCNDINEIGIMVHKKKVQVRKKINPVKYGQQPAVAFQLSHSGWNKTSRLLTKHISMTEINKVTKLSNRYTKSSEAVNKKIFFNSKFVVNQVMGYHYNEHLNMFNFPTQKKFKVYCCQLSAPEGSCCCSCNSDVMFEVMKGLYSCYKKKNCDNCDCILCSHLLPEERRFTEVKKSIDTLGTIKKKSKIKKAEKILEKKTPAEREEFCRRVLRRVLKELAKAGQPLPKGKTASEKALIKKIIAELGVPYSETATLLERMKKAKESKKKTPSEKLRKSKVAKLITPLEGKTLSQKEKILKGLAKEGLLLPEAKTASEKKLGEKVRAELALPPEPQTPSMKKNYKKAESAGLMQPLKGKSAQEKKRILHGLQGKGIPLPEGRTSSEKALIAKVKIETHAPSITSSTKLSKAKAAGLITPLEGKSPSQKDKIIKGLAMQGLPLPEGKTASEKKLIDKARSDLGLPPEPKTASMKEKFAKETSTGLLRPLEGKSPQEKERILQDLHDKGIRLPEGQTATEKAVIAKVKAGARVPSVTPSAKLQKAKAAGLLTPIKGKPQEQQEKILKGLAMQRLPLPEGKTASEKKVIEKVRAELGLPPEPKTASIKEKYKKAARAGLLQPLEGKSPIEKEKILKSLQDKRIPLPKGRTASEKALIAKVKVEEREPSVITSEKLRKAKAAGLLTPLEGKSSLQKEKILKGLAKEGLPLPKAETSSEKQIIEKVRADLGLPPERKTATIKEKYRKAARAGLLQPLESKSPTEKEKYLKSLQDKGIPLPEERTASEKDLKVQVKVGKTVREPSAKKTALSITSEKLKKAKAAGLLTPLEGKTREQKEKILKGLVDTGLPVPKGKTASEKKIIKKIKNEFGVLEKTSSEKMRKAKKSGLLTPLEGKTHLQKEKILRGRVQAGLPLPIGKTSSERALILKIKEDTGYVSPTPSEKFKRAKDAGLLTPLEGKTSSAKEKILRDRVAAGVPIPQGKTLSEKEIVRKITAGEPPAVLQRSKKFRLAKTPSEIEKILKSHRKAEAAGIVTPVKGKTPSQKERIMRDIVVTGLTPSEVSTASEKSMIKKDKAEEKQSAKATAGLLTPLKGKTPSQKEKIIKCLAEAGIPLPEGRTPTEKALIQKVRTELGMPPPAKTRSEKEVVRKAKEEGLLTPIAGKSAKEKERILKGLAEAGLPLPVGKTASEKELVKKVRAKARLPPEPTPSEKRGKIKTKSKKRDISPSKRRVKTIAAGISQKLEEIIKTTTCDRGCGCDRKKIKFKHSYVKVRVTSPDISSLCDCPDECIPGIKTGAFIDNDRIKVIVGRVSGATSFTSQFHSLETFKNIITLYDKILTSSDSSNTSIDTVDTPFGNKFETCDLKKSLFDACTPQRCPIDVDLFKTDLDTLYTYSSGSHDSYTDDKKCRIESDTSYYLLESSSYENYNVESDRFVDCSRNIEPSKNICRSTSFTLQEYSVSYDSIQILKSESSVSLNTDSSVTSVTSLSTSSYSALSSTQYLYFPVSNGNFRNSTVEETERIPNKIYYSENDDSADDTIMSETDNQVSVAHFNRARTGNRDYGPDCIRRKQNDYFTYLLSGTKLDNEQNTKQISTRKTKNGEPVVVISNMDSKHDITTMVDQIISKNEFSDASSIFVVVPTSDDNDSDTSSDCSSICIQLSQNYPNWNQMQCNIEDTEISSRTNSSSTRGLKISTKSKTFCAKGMQATVASFHNKETMFHHRLLNACSHRFEEKEKTKNELCQISTPYQNMVLYHGVSTDTTSDRPCCCAPKIQGIHIDKPERR